MTRTRRRTRRTVRLSPSPFSTGTTRSRRATKRVSIQTKHKYDDPLVAKMKPFPKV